MVAGCVGPATISLLKERARPVGVLPSDPRKDAHAPPFPEAMSKGECPIRLGLNSGAAFDLSKKMLSVVLAQHHRQEFFQIWKLNPFAGRSRFNPEYAGDEMGKTLFAVVAAGGGVAMGLTTGAMVGSAIANTFFNVSIGTIRAMRRLRRRRQSS